MKIQIENLSTDQIMSIIRIFTPSYKIDAIENNKNLTPEGKLNEIRKLVPSVYKMKIGK